MYLLPVCAAASCCFEMALPLKEFRYFNQTKIMDFTLNTYTTLLQMLKDNGYGFVTFERYCTDKSVGGCKKFVILRHDVDLKAENSFASAQIEHSLDIQASYYFRIVEESNQPEIIKAIAAMGHEIGYHYEDMTICNGNVEKAMTHFKDQLRYFRQFYSVKTICMHGSPCSKYDSRDLWKHYDYHDFDIIGEPYFDVDFSQVFYLTDTGRRWDGFNMSVRDKIPVYQDQWLKEGLVYHSTNDIIQAVKTGTLPEKLMMTTHPQRWTDAWDEWLVEKSSQSIKNVVKRVSLKLSSRK